MAPRGRKKVKTASNDACTVTKYPLKYPGFDGIRDVDFSQDKDILEKYGIPTPPKNIDIVLNPDLESNLYNTVRFVLERYEELLLETLGSCSNEKYEKRKGMLIKLVGAVSLKWYNAYRWKASDRTLVKSMNIESYTMARQLQRRAHQDLQVYQILWQDHCQSMRMLLGEWNEAIEIMEKHKLVESTENCDCSGIVNKLNEIVEACSNDSNETKVILSVQNDINDLKSLLKNLSFDLNLDSSLQEERMQLNDFKNTKVNQFQAMVNEGIKDFEKLLENLSVQSNILAQFSRLLSRNMFKRLPIPEYIKRIQDLPSVVYTTTQSTTNNNE